MLTEKSRKLLRGEERLELRRDRYEVQELNTARPEQKLHGDNAELWEELRALRLKLAKEREVPPFQIFSDATLRGMMALRPSSLEEMHQVSGVGQFKLDNYGEAFLEVLARHAPEGA